MLKSNSVRPCELFEFSNLESPNQFYPETPFTAFNLYLCP